jgi:methylenetetrahydrofolate dehydrogenase (NADP+)/methenyltetrahydrofolate cyclohydrolase
MAQRIDGKAVAARVRAEVAEGTAKLRAEKGITPGLAVVRVGEDPASKIYVSGKRKAALEVGFQSWEHHLGAEAPESAVLDQVAALNQDPAVHGVLVQLPLPKHMDPDRVIRSLRPEKDADGFHPVNAGQLFLGRPAVLPCTPAGILRLLAEVGFNPSGKRAVVVGRSNIVGKPMAQLLLLADATVTVCHRKSQLEQEVPRADLLVAAVGVPELIRGSWVKPGAVVIDVGMNRLPDGKLVGDVEFAAAAERASFITPVPGGVGPMTIAMLMANTLAAAALTSGAPRRSSESRGNG